MVGLTHRTTPVPSASGIFSGSATQDFGATGVKPAVSSIMGAPSPFNMEAFSAALGGDTIGASAIARGIQATIGTPAHTGGNIQKPSESLLSM